MRSLRQAFVSHLTASQGGVCEFVEQELLYRLLATDMCRFNTLNSTYSCFLNVTPDEVVRSLFFNKKNDSLITVSVFRYDDFSSLKCRSTPIEYIRRGKPGAGFPLFESESLRWPGFVEFDDVNNKVLVGLACFVSFVSSSARDLRAHGSLLHALTFADIQRHRRHIQGLGPRELHAHVHYRG